MQQPFINMKSADTEIKLGMSEVPMGCAMVFEPPKPDNLGATSESGVIHFPTRTH